MFSPKEIIRICDKKGFKCWYCGKIAETLDHFIPRKKGGSNKDDNKVPACRKCNTIKRAFDLETFRNIMMRKKYKIPYFKKDQIEWLELQGFVFKEYPIKFYFERRK